MDKKNWIAIAACMLLIFAYPAIVNHFYPPPKLTAEQQAEQQKEKEAAAGLSVAANNAGVVAPASTTAGQPAMASEKTPVSEQKEPSLAPEQLVSLRNDFIEVEFTTHGGAIRKVSLLKHKAAENSPVILNRGGPLPVLNLRGWGGNYGVSGYTVESQTPSSITMVRPLSPTLSLQRTYTLVSDYNIELAQTVVNTGAKPEVLGPYVLDLGSTTPVYAHAAERQMIGLSWYTANENYVSHKVHEFDPASIPLLGIRLWAGKSLLENKPEDKLSWVALKSQFFVILINPVDFTADKVTGIRQEYPDLRDKSQGPTIPDGIMANMTVPGVQVEAGASVTQKFDVYAGPKENSRLIKMSENRAKVMEFGMFSYVSRFLLATMNRIHSVVGNYGWSIVILTVFLKAILWFPQGMANKSMKRMSAVAPVIKEVQDKYKDKPEKLNEEMIKVYRDYGVNPVGGCFPMLLQFPIFLGFYSMLQTAIELRHQSFAWITDLSQADTIYLLPLHYPSLGMDFDFPINPMPLIMACTMYWSMHVTPQPAGVDNPMVKIMKFMPLMFLAFCYNFSAALSLYWTVQNLLSIVQLYYNTHFQKEVTLEEMKLQVAAKKKSQKKKKS